MRQVGRGTEGMEVGGGQVGDSHKRCFIYTSYHRVEQGCCGEGRTSCMTE